MGAMRQESVLLHGGATVSYPFDATTSTLEAMRQSAPA